MTDQPNAPAPRLAAPSRPFAVTGQEEHDDHEGNARYDDIRERFAGERFLPHEDEEAVDAARQADAGTDPGSILRRDTYSEAMADKHRRAGAR